MCRRSLQQAAEDFHDGGGSERRQGQEFPFPSENAVRNQGMSVGIEVGAVATERLQGDDAAGADVGAVRQRPEGLQDRGIGGL